MNYSVKLEDQAKDFCRTFVSDSRIKSIFLGGSGSRDLADKYSDLEIYIIWNIKTSKNIRDSIIKEINHLVLVDESFEDPAEWTTSILINDAKFDIYHWEESTVDYFYSEINQNLSTSSSIQCSISSILDAKVIKGEEYINSLKNRFSKYPDGLSEKIIKSKSFYESWGARLVLLERNDLLALSNMMNLYLIQALKVLFAINKVYLRSTNFKWLEYQDSLLKIKPKDLAVRVRFIVNNVNKEGLTELNILITEVFELAKQTFPEADLKDEQKIFKYLRN